MYDGPGKLAICVIGTFKIQKMIKEDKFTDFDMASSFVNKEGEFHLGSLISSDIGAYADCQDKIMRAEYLKIKYEEKLTNSNI